MTFDVPSIPEFFAGKKLFITGGTGFMGKVLIEKLLRSCPGVETIYMLIRNKKGKEPEERIAEMLTLPLFDRLHKEQPDAAKKIKPVLGDVSQLGLGLNDEDRDLLIREVSIVYHSAASVRFDDPLTDAILMNTRGTKETLELSKRMVNLLIFVHISTSYSNTDRKVIGEQIYPPHADWRDSIKLAETADRHMMDVLTQKYISPLPNTYTFTKSLSEHVVEDLCDGAVPSIIFRPSIVISTFKDPFPGWLDNFNGPVGLVLAIGSGVLKTVYTKPNNIADFMPVDLVMKAILIGTWKKAITQDLEKRNTVEVYNCSKNDQRDVTMNDLVYMGQSLVSETAMSKMLWYPHATITACWYYHFLKVVFYQLLPALFVDGILAVIGQKPMLIKIHRRIYTANMALQYFLSNEWNFINLKAANLEHEILPQDSEDFSYNVENLDLYEYFKNALLGGRHYLLKEDPKTLPQAVKFAKRLYVISQIFNIFCHVVGFWLIFFKLDLIRIIVQLYEQLYLYITTK